jgi:hypothetical protein
VNPVDLVTEKLEVVASIVQAESNREIKEPMSWHQIAGMHDHGGKKGAA